MDDMDNTTKCSCGTEIGVPGTKLVPVGGKCDGCILFFAADPDADFVTFVDFGYGEMVSNVDTRGDF